MIVLTFPVPAHPLSINESNRMHWAARRRRLEPWAVSVTAEFRSCGWTGPQQPVHIQVTIPFSKRGRRDPHNYTGTVVKTVVDALVREGLVPDDAAEWVVVEDPVFAVPSTTAQVNIWPQEKV